MDNWLDEHEEYMQSVMPKYAVSEELIEEIADRIYEKQLENVQGHLTRYQIEVILREWLKR